MGAGRNYLLLQYQKYTESDAEKVKVQSTLKKKKKCSLTIVLLKNVGVVGWCDGAG